MKAEFKLSKVRKHPEFIKGFCASSTIRRGQKVVVIDGQTWELQLTKELEDAFNNHGFNSVMCIISCQTYKPKDSKPRLIAIAKPHYYSSYYTALRESYNGRITV